MIRASRRIRGLAALPLCLGLLHCAGEGPKWGTGQDWWVPNKDGAASRDGAARDGAMSRDGYKADKSAVCAKATHKLTETQESFKAPKGARYMHVKAWGAGGNGEGQCTPATDGGIGGYSEAVFKVTAGTEYVIIVGKRGRAGLTGEQRMRFGFGDWGGGGLTGVFRGPKPIAASDWSKALIIAGGGGGASAPGCNPGGTGNHKSAGGMGTMQGGKGADGVNGGAGGYRGGKGGAKRKGGSGGSGHVASGALKSRILYAQPKAAVPPNATDSDYDGKAGKEEASGRLVLKFVCSVPPVL